ncbi:MAG: hypothetical protein HY016_02395 [Nitrosomonadales bacterium]|nr:hypothetical protein [Nitrosomonadales bacterium]
MKSVHLVIPDLFLPKDFAAEVCAGLSLPVLEKLLGRGQSEMLAPVALENLLCELFGMPSHGIAPVSAAFDGLAAGCWMRADPVHLSLQREQMLMMAVNVGGEEASAMCASLNQHFAGQGMEFFAPHPQRWYVRLHALPHIDTTPLSQVIGGDVRRVLPVGSDALHWHQLFNEVQMLLFAHPLNEARESRGELTINSVWFWGGGESVSPQKNYDGVSADDVLPEMLAAAASVPYAPWAKQWRDSLTPTPSRGERGCVSDDRQLLVWTRLQAALQRGDLAAWRTALQDFETGYAQPLWQALRCGKIARLQLDILCGDHIRRVRLTRGDSWAFWRRAKRLADYSSS